MPYPTRILHVITTINRGGAENHLAALIDQQADTGLEVMVAYLKGDGYWGDPLRDRGVEVVPLNGARNSDMTTAIRLRRVIDGFGPDVVHAHMPPAELCVRLAMLGRSAPPVVISKHVDGPFYRGPGEHLVARWAAGRARRIIAISGAVERYFGKRWPGRLAERLTTVRYGIDLAPYDQITETDVRRVRQDWGVSPDTLLIGTVARMVPQKALDVLLEGFAQFRTRRADTAAKLVLVGQGPLEAQLREQARALGVDDDIIWAGFREDIPTVMKAFDVFALTSVFEGFGLVLLEAMAASTPIVASDISAIPEVVADGTCGLLVPARQPGRVADAFVRLSDTGVRQRFGAAGYDRAKNEFGLRVMHRRTYAVYRQALGLPADEAGEPVDDRLATGLKRTG